MRLNRKEVLEHFADRIGRKYPLRWTDELTSLGDFSGRDVTIEVFNIPASEQRTFLAETRDVRAEVAKLLGETTQFVFHTPEATREHYAHVLDECTTVSNNLINDL